MNAFVQNYFVLPVHYFLTFLSSDVVCLWDLARRNYFFVVLPASICNLLHICTDSIVPRKCNAILKLVNTEALMHHPVSRLLLSCIISISAELLGSLGTHDGKPCHFQFIQHSDLKNLRGWWVCRSTISVEHRNTSASSGTRKYAGGSNNSPAMSFC